MVFWSFSSSTHAAAMESSKSMFCSERWFFPSSKLKSRETLLALACVAFIALSYLALASTPTGFYGSFLPLQIPTFFGMDDDEADPKQYERRMQEVFDKAAMPNRTVIITTLNAAWAEKNTMIDMFLESFQHGEGTQRLLQHLIIVCVDQKAYDRCLAIHSHCLRIKTGGVNFSGEQALLSEDYIKMIWRRIKFLKTVLEMDYSFIFTDADVLWFRDPFPRLQSDTKADLQMACDRYNGRPWDVRNTPNAGFTYVRANQRTVRFYKYWYSERKRDPKMADQEVFNAIKYEETFKSIGMNLHFLDTQFFGGFCGIRFTDMTKAVTMHATCCKGLGNKLIDLRRILEGWKEWQQQSFQQASTPVVSPPPPPLVVGKKHTRKGKGSSTKGRALVAAHQQLDRDPHFKVPRACPRSWRSH